MNYPLQKDRIAQMRSELNLTEDLALQIVDLKEQNQKLAERVVLLRETVERLQKELAAFK